MKGIQLKITTCSPGTMFIGFMLNNLCFLILSLFLGYFKEVIYIQLCQLKFRVMREVLNDLDRI
jgi:hypothetical protein